MRIFHVPGVDEMITFHVSGIPVPQARARAFTRPGMKGVRFYDPQTSKTWKQIIALKADAEMKSRGLFPVEDAVKLSVCFSLKSPKDRDPNWHHTRKPDLDNLLKSVKDALKNVCWKDDSQVVEIYCMKQYAFTGEEGVTIKIDVL